MTGSGGMHDVRRCSQMDNLDSICSFYYNSVCVPPSLSSAIKNNNYKK